jgi:hypothetical protein
MKSKQLIKPVLIVIAAMLVVKAGYAQYYYKDVIINKELGAEMARLKEQKMRTVNVISLEDNGVQSEGFFCQKKINKNYTEVEINTRTSTSYPDVFTSSFSKEGLLLQSVDSTEAASTTAIYTYNDKQQLLRIVSSSHFASDDYADNTTEEHLYQYDANGFLARLWVINNNKDTAEFLFKEDENNNVAIEKSVKTGDIYYYYYNSKNNLTDVVHTYNDGRNKLIPDYKFDYNSSGLITQMIASEKEGAYYFTWKYSYDNGLRTMERCYTKEGRLTGSVEYEYK